MCRNELPCASDLTGEPVTGSGSTRCRDIWGGLATSLMSINPHISSSFDIVLFTQFNSCSLWEQNDHSNVSILFCHAEQVLLTTLQTWCYHMAPMDKNPLWWKSWLLTKFSRCPILNKVGLDDITDSGTVSDILGESEITNTLYPCTCLIFIITSYTKYTKKWNEHIAR